MQIMKKLIIHMGVHRSGSTSLQSYLKASASALEEADIKLLTRDELKGVVFKGYLTRLKHISPNSLLRTYIQNHVETTLNKVSCSNIIMTEENLIGGMPVMRSGVGTPYPKANLFLRSLNHWRHDFDIYPRFIVRRQDRWIESLYAFQVYRGLGARFSEFVSYFSRLNMDWGVLIDDLDHFKLIDKSIIMPLQTCSGRAYEDWVPKFLGIEHRHFGVATVGTNESMLLRDLKLFWALNKIGWAKGKRGKRRNLRRKLVQLSHSHGDRELERAEIGDYLAEAGVRVPKQQLKHVESAYLGMEIPYFSDQGREIFLKPYQDANKRFLAHSQVMATCDLWQV